MKKFLEEDENIHNKREREKEREKEHAHIYFKCKGKNRRKMSKGMNKRDLIVEPAEAAALEETEGE